jgi:hypothetical protein
MGTRGERVIDETVSKGLQLASHSHSISFECLMTKMASWLGHIAEQGCSSKHEMSTLRNQPFVTCKRKPLLAAVH